VKLTLAECGIDYPTHQLDVTSSQPSCDSSSRSSTADSPHEAIQPPQV